MIYQKDLARIAVDSGWKHIGVAVLHGHHIFTETLILPEDFTKTERAGAIAGFLWDIKQDLTTHFHLIMEDYDPRVNRTTGTKTMFVMGVIMGILRHARSVEFYRNREWAGLNERRLKSKMRHGYTYDMPQSDHEWDSLRLLLATDYQSRLEAMR